MVGVPRVWTALLLLAAVFGVHGVQCMAVDPALEHASVAHALTASVDVPAPVGQVAVVAALPGHHSAAPQGAGEAGATGSLDSWHDGHALAVCLAVLLAGLTVAGTLVRLRGTVVRLVRGSLSSPRWTTGWSRQPRPPDLSVLCLLRI
ncbi:DUF6153 family protein [Modestobacter sp. VKM Ac-2983]|uniref:DUF6153 family protein n=1 Tax=Modestobacter sp. VKM Ac-2983 TaxID=3004137 RepID=UPI0022ABC2BA|nr:DUF6153 family protein [Modestobacter sp. VKM Ac-2983]MCZ2805027.1 DUF6153 family protein [Modestobacter sp. VKM Ac-2983]